MGGPTVMGTDIRPNRKPMAWDTSSGPTSSKAIGAMMQMKQPSKSPISRHTAISPPKILHRGIIMDMRPMTKKEVTWKDKREECPHMTTVLQIFTCSFDGLIIYL